MGRRRNEGGGSLRTLIMFVLGFVGLGLILYTMFWPSGGGMLEGVLPQATSTFRTGPTVIQAIQREAKLETIAMAIQNDTTVTREHGLFGVCSESITYVGYFNVSAGIDLSLLTTDHISVTNDGIPDQANVTITLPPAQIMHNELDTANSRIVSQETPRWIPSCDHHIAEMTVEAQDKLRLYAESAARERGIINLAEQHAAEELERLLEAAGYQRVTVRYASAMPTPVPTASP